jgi:pyruvate formate lyase activating enzyme
MNGKEALFYKKMPGGKVRCSLCALRCTISDGKLGACRVRVNRGGTLVSLTYGMLTSSASDPIEKKPLFHFLPGSRSYSVATAGCNLQCPWCQNHDLSQSPRRDLSPDRMAAWTPPDRIVKAASRGGCASISYTYTEPTIFYEYARETGVLARKRGLKNVFVSNGMMTPEVVEDSRVFLDAANIDLKAGTKEFYRKLCKGSLEAVVESIRLMWKLGIWVEVTTLLIPGHNDSDEHLRTIVDLLVSVSPDVPWHISRFHPDNEWLAVAPTPIASLKAAAALGVKAGLRYVYVGNVAAEGFEDTRCPQCGNLLIERVGFSATLRGMEEGRCRRCGTVPAGRWDAEASPDGECE